MRIEVRPRADSEINAAAAWYERERPGLGASFTQAVMAAFASIAEQPLAYPHIRRGARRFVMRKFPYIVIYRVEGDAIVIYACIHSHRDPAHWRSRL
ncbi:MAG: type II toxin-antitoxin system RelE/ParE family toxin [Alphaproteobacteria bacterium]|nr:type II toxin-antitoxin system RelE/ParE family toxin [Alphaproteobacteria bacterium]